jgi:histidinol-phosphatase (PHP family)
MIIDQYSDGHVHTALCHHATGAMEDFVVAAIKANLRTISFLEHLEEGIDTSRVTWLTENDFDTYFREGKRLQERYENEIRIELGVEVGYNPDCTDTILQRLSTRKWDRIGLSYHFHNHTNAKQHLNLVSKRDTKLLQLKREEAIVIEEEYYSILLEAIQTIPATVLCHLDGVLRYYPLRQEIEPPWHLIEALLDAMKAFGIALEVNTSGIAIRGEVFPQKRILAMAMKKNIPLVAGSDAHKPEDVGYCFDKLNTLINLK